MKEDARRKRERSERRGTRFNVTRGQLNRLIDLVFHRHFTENPALILLDGVAHALVERAPEESLRKFVK